MLPIPIACLPLLFGKEQVERLTEEMVAEHVTRFTLAAVNDLASGPRERAVGSDRSES